jgi:hypothetical protein
MGGGLITSWISYQFVNVDGITCDNVNTNNNMFWQISFRASLDSHWSFLQGLKFGLLTSTTIDLNLLAGATFLDWVGIAGSAPDLPFCWRVLEFLRSCVLVAVLHCGSFPAMSTSPGSEEKKTNYTTHQYLEDLKQQYDK